LHEIIAPPLTARLRGGGIGRAAVQYLNILQPGEVSPEYMGSATGRPATQTFGVAVSGASANTFPFPLSRLRFSASLRYNLQTVVLICANL
jgi:hypothetical protein